MSYAKRFNALIFICFFISGAAGLIYEVVWDKYLVQILGNTAYAHTLVLATFMAGLAFGSFLFGRVADKLEDRFSIYGLMEIIIGLFGIATPLLFSLSRGLYLAAARNPSVSIPVIIISKFFISGLIVFFPTILMGGTLPILSRLLVRSLSARGKTVAGLYYINSFGAVTGAILAGFFLVYWVGFANSIFVAASLNLIVGLVVIISRHSIQPLLAGVVPACPEKAVIKEDEIVEHPSRIIKIAFAGIFLSGCIAMLYELVWIRLLSTIFGSSTYSFSLMLAAFITGITLGSFLISKFMPGERHAFFAFGLCEMLIGFALLLSLYFYERLPFVFSKLTSVFVRTPETFPIYSFVEFLLAFLLMLPATIFLGMTLPLVCKITSSSIRRFGRSIGNVFAVNTAGNILGAMITGLLLIKVLGLKGTIELGILLNIGVGMVVFIAESTFKLRNKLAIACLFVACFIVYKAAMPDWNKAYFTAEFFRLGPRQENFQQFRQAFKDSEILYHKDGVNATVTVLRYGENVVLYINGKADASSIADMPTQILMAQLPLLIKPDAEDVMVMGLGSGVTCGSALTHPIKSLDLIEISPAVLEASAHFADVNYNALDDERLVVHIEDVRTYIQQTTKKYDIIINGPSTPWVSGIGSLFSVEYFQDCLNQLNEGGLAVQFVNGFEMDDETFHVIVRTFTSVFPETVLWNSGVNDVILIGSDKEIKIDFDMAERRMASSRVAQDLARIKVHDLFTVLSLQLSSNETISKVIDKRGRKNTAYMPLIEYMAPLALYMGATIRNTLTVMDERNLILAHGGLMMRDYVKDRGIGRSNLKNLYAYISAHKTYNEKLFLPLVAQWHNNYPDDKDARMARISHNIDNIQGSIDALERMIETDTSFRTMDLYAAEVMRRYYALKSFLFPEVFTDTVSALAECAEKVDEKKAPFYILLGSVYWDMRDYEKSTAALIKAKEALSSPQEAAEMGINYKWLLNAISRKK